MIVSVWKGAAKGVIAIMKEQERLRQMRVEDLESVLHSVQRLRPHNPGHFGAPILTQRAMNSDGYASDDERLVQSCPIDGKKL